MVSLGIYAKGFNIHRTRLRPKNRLVTRPFHKIQLIERKDRLYSPRPRFQL